MPEISLLAAFLTGLLGGAHCVGMCGGIVTAMSFQLDGRQPVTFHVAYSAGRVLSYTVNHAAEARRLRQLGVEGLITDIMHLPAAV